MASSLHIYLQANKTLTLLERSCQQIDSTLACEQAFGRAGDWGDRFFAIFPKKREPVHRLIPRFRRSANRALDGIKVI